MTPADYEWQSIQSPPLKGQSLTIITQKQYHLCLGVIVISLLSYNGNFHLGEFYG